MLQTWSHVPGQIVIKLNRDQFQPLLDELRKVSVDRSDSAIAQRALFFCLLCFAEKNKEGFSRVEIISKNWSGREVGSQYLNFERNFQKWKEGKYTIPVLGSFQEVLGGPRRAPQGTNKDRPAPGK